MQVWDGLIEIDDCDPAYWDTINDYLNAMYEGATTWQQADAMAIAWSK